MAAAGRALIAVYDKRGVVEFAAGLAGLGWELIASEGTARVISGAGLPVSDVADYSDSPTMLGHRVVTLHPRVNGGILADRDDPGHRADMVANGIESIDLVVVNLYPFTASPSVEMIDIGGPAMLRAAAKNHAHVGAVSDPADYPAVLAELRAGSRLSQPTLLRLARKAFTQTAAYDAAIIAWLSGDPSGERAAEPSGTAADGSGDGPAAHAARPRRAPTSATRSEGLAERILLDLELAETLRYGENPHQRGARYRRRGSQSFFDGVISHGGPTLSYLNLMDAQAAWRIAHDLGERCAAVIVKHANPCGAAVAASLAQAYAKALACDPLSAFGGVLAVNGVLDHATADAMTEAPQADVVIAAGYEEGVVERLAARRANTRLLQGPQPARTAGAGQRLQVRSLGSAMSDFLVQDPAVFVADRSQWRVVTAKAPSEAELDDAEFAWRVCGHVGSNAVVLARDGAAWGIGAGQQNRVEAARIAADKAVGRAAGGACASDAFYPFPDGVRVAADAGAAVVVQPGGSLNDPDVIAAADELGLVMLFTGERQFRH